MYFLVNKIESYFKKKNKDKMNTLGNITLKLH